MAALTVDDLQEPASADPEAQSFGAAHGFDPSQPCSSRKNRKCHVWADRLAAALAHAACAVLPSPLLPSSWGYRTWPDVHHADTAYLDGLRGLGAVVVYVQHFLMPFHADLMTGLHAQRATSLSFLWSDVFQWPVLRLLYHGSFAVSLFFVLSGVVLSRGPVARLRDLDGGRAAASLSLSSASFRRGIRLFAPAATVVAIMVVAVHLGAGDEAARMDDAGQLPTAYYDLRMARRRPTLAAQTADGLLFVASQLVYPAQWLQPVPMVVVGHVGTGVYGFHLWTIAVEFWASQLLFLAWLALLPIRPTYRRAVFMLLALFCMWLLRWEVALFLAGALVADTMPRASPPARGFRYRLFSIMKELLLGLGCFCGLWIGSMPDFHGESLAGFQSLSALMPVAPVWHGLGAICVVVCTSRCAWLQTLLCHGFAQYLGRISFSLYLVHVPIVTFFGWRLVPWLWQLVGTSMSSIVGEVCILGGGLLVLVVAIWVADIFWRLVDMPSIQLAKALQEAVQAERDKGE